jgi:hypothetical protein
MVFFGIGILMFLPFVVFVTLWLVFWIMMLVDAATRKFKNGTDKIVWVLVVIFVTFIGSLIYYFVVFNKDQKKSIKWLWITLLIASVLMIGLIIALFALVESSASLM